jgi:hypothetical protein
MSISSMWSEDGFFSNLTLSVCGVVVFGHRFHPEVIDVLIKATR